RRPREGTALARGEPVASEELTPLEILLTARWRLYSSGRRGLAATEVEHVAWPTQRAEPLCVHDELIPAGGLPEPVGAPLVLFSTGVAVRFRPRRPLCATLGAVV